MPPLRKATAYSKKKVTPYTRVSKKKGKSYIKTSPQQKIVKFAMGKEQQYSSGKLLHTLMMVSTENVQVRHNALEACRQFVNKKLETELKGQYYFRIIPYSHHIQRENRMLTGAGADRMQTGMQLSFGKTMGKSAIVKKNTPLFFVAVQNPRAIEFTRKLFKQIRSKLPGKTRIDYELKKKE
jgi:large subunit ribosomal protein L10e